MSRTFEHFNPIGDPCPVCKKKTDKPTILVPIDGTEEDNIEEAVQVHYKCAVANRYNKKAGVLYLKIYEHDISTTKEHTPQNN